MAATIDMWSSLGVDFHSSEPFNGGGDLMDALEPFISASQSPSPSPSLSSSSSSDVFYGSYGSFNGYSGCGVGQPGFIGLNPLTPLQVRQIQAQINLQAQQMMGSAPFQSQWPQQPRRNLSFLAPRPSLAENKSLDSKKSKPAPPQKPKEEAVEDDKSSVPAEAGPESSGSDSGSSGSVPETYGSDSGSGGSSPVSDLTFPDFTDEESTWDMLSELQKYPSHEIDWASL
nr:ethylene-responsive transcription factor RAP2-4-like [Ipomoea batatas]